MSDDSSDARPRRRWLWMATITASVVAAIATAFFMYDGWREHTRVQAAVRTIAVVFDDVERCARGTVGPADDLGARITVEELAGVITRDHVAACADAADHSLARYTGLRDRHAELREFWSAVDDLRHPPAGTRATSLCAALERGRAEVAKLRGDPHVEVTCGVDPPAVVTANPPADQAAPAAPPGDGPPGVPGAVRVGRVAAGDGIDVASEVEAAPGAWRVVRVHHPAGDPHPQPVDAWSWPDGADRQHLDRVKLGDTWFRLAP